MGKNDLQYLKFKHAMNNDPFVGTEGNSVRVDAAVVKQLVYSDPESAERWFHWFMGEASTMTNASFAKIMAQILLIVAGFLDELGNPNPLKEWKKKYS